MFDVTIYEKYIKCTVFSPHDDVIDRNVAQQEWMNQKSKCRAQIQLSATAPYFIHMAVFHIDARTLRLYEARGAPEVIVPAARGWPLLAVD